MNEDFNSLILQNSPIGYCVITKDLDLEYINDKLLKYLNVTLQQMSSKSWIETIIEKNYLKSRRKIVFRWLRMRFNTRTFDNKYVIKIFDDLNLEFFVQIDVLNQPAPKDQTEGFKKIPNHLSNRRLVTIYPVSGTILLHQSRLNRTLNVEYQIAGKIQRNINNYILDMVEGRYFKYYFKRLFMPSGILSGDMVNIKPVSRRYTSVFLGDGRGHGLPAALYSTLIHSYLNMMASEVNHGTSSTGRLMEQINKYAHRDFSETGELYFFSGVYGLIDGNTREFRMTNAGHPFPIFIRNGEVSRLQSNGPIVGIDKNSLYSESTFELKNGDVILYFSDGIYDVMTGETDTDHDAITSIVKDYLGKNQNNAAGVFSFLTGKIQEFKSLHDIGDDITILQMSVEEKIN